MMRLTGGDSKGRKFAAPPGREARPPLVRMRQSIFSILRDRIEDSRVLDLFAGTGAFGLEALSRGAREVVFVESDKNTARILQRNLQTLGFRKRATVVVATALGDLSVTLQIEVEPAPGGGPPTSVGFDLIFMDPPFKMTRDPGTLSRLVLRMSELLEGKLLNSQGLLIVRYPADLSEKLPMIPVDTRKYGKSVVAFYRKPPAGEV